MHQQISAQTAETTPITRKPSESDEPEYTVGPAVTVPITETERQQAVRALAVLIAAWWTQNPPSDSDSRNDEDKDT